MKNNQEKKVPRSRKAIEKEIIEPNDVKTWRRDEVILEVLLDIRDLLQPEIGGEMVTPDTTGGEKKVEVVEYWDKENGTHEIMFASEFEKRQRGEDYEVLTSTPPTTKGCCELCFMRVKHSSALGLGTGEYRCENPDCPCHQKEKDGGVGVKDYYSKSDKDAITTLENGFTTSYTSKSFSELFDERFVDYHVTPHGEACKIEEVYSDGTHGIAMVANLKSFFLNEMEEICGEIEIIPWARRGIEVEKYRDTVLSIIRIRMWEK